MPLRRKLVEMEMLHSNFTVLSVVDEGRSSTASTGERLCMSVFSTHKKLGMATHVWRSSIDM
jgi:hypothetical protein